MTDYLKSCLSVLVGGYIVLGAIFALVAYTSMALGGLEVNITNLTLPFWMPLVVFVVGFPILVVGFLIATAIRILL